MRTNIMPAHAGTMPEIRLRSRPRHVGRNLRPRPLAGLGSEASRATVPRSGRRSLLASIEIVAQMSYIVRLTREIPMAATAFVHARIDHTLTDEPAAVLAQPLGR